MPMNTLFVALCFMVTIILWSTCCWFLILQRKKQRNVKEIEQYLTDNNQNWKIQSRQSKFETNYFIFFFCFVLEPHLEIIKICSWLCMQAGFTSWGLWCLLGFEEIEPRSVHVSEMLYWLYYLSIQKSFFYYGSFIKPGVASTSIAFAYIMYIWFNHKVSPRKLKRRKLWEN